MRAPVSESLTRAALHNPADCAIRPKDAVLRHVGLTLLPCLRHHIRDSLTVLRMDVTKKIANFPSERDVRNAKHGTQIAKPSMSPGSEIPFPSDRFAGLHRHAKLIAVADQLCLCSPSLCSLP